MNILAIETSCDETAIAYIQAIETPAGVDFTVLGNITHTQLEHVEYGGVFPAIAKREHQINLPLILEKIMRDQETPDIICVTSGPGLEPALWCGIVFAKELGEKWNVPVIPVNHMEGHILSVLVPPLLAGEGSGVRFEFKNEINFPALALLISGGHTELVLVNGIGDYKIIGKTRDDAVGEAFDKVARILGLPYPGGPEISKLAQQYSHRRSTTERLPLQEGDSELIFPRPMLHSQDYDFSFSGLKTAVLYHVQNLQTPSALDAIAPLPLGKGEKARIAHAFQEAVTEVLVKKTFTACEEFGVQTLIVAGGVSANNRIKEALQEKISEIISIENILFPARELTGDNALMIALAGYFKYKKSPDAVYDDIRAEGNLSL